MNQNETQKNKTSNVDPDKATQLKKYERTIKNYQKCYFKVGEALSVIRAKKLYEISGSRNYKTFEEYCDKTFGFSRAHGYRLIKFYETASILGKDENWSISERIVRELGTVKAEQRKDVWEEANELAKQEEKDVDYTHVRKAKNKVLQADSTAGTVYCPELNESVPLNDLATPNFYGAKAKNSTTFMALVKFAISQNIKFSEQDETTLKNDLKQLLESEANTQMDKLTNIMKGTKVVDENNNAA